MVSSAAMLVRSKSTRVGVAPVLEAVDADEQRQMLTGGAPHNRTYGFFGGWNDAMAPSSGRSLVPFEDLLRSLRPGMPSYALDLAIGPLRPLFDDIVAPSLARFDARWISSLSWQKTDIAASTLLTNFQNGDQALAALNLRR